MRIALPQRIPVGKAFLCTSLLVLVELLEGTNPVYSALVFCYLMLSVFAFNTAGGFTRPSGAYIFYYGTLVAGVGTVYKALLGQAADSHLASPLLIMSVYTATVGGLLLAAYLARRVVNSRDGVAGILNVPNLDFGLSSLGCFVMVVFTYAPGIIGVDFGGPILRAIALINYFLPLSILLGTVAAVRNSGGRRSTSPLTLCILVWATYSGLLSFSKQGMFSPFVCWVLGLAWARFRLRLGHILVIIVFAVIAQSWMVPLANVGREETVTGSEADRLSIVEKYVEHPQLLRENNRERQEGYAGLDLWYYGTPQGIFDRFTMLPNDAQLISFSADGNYFGYLPIISYFENWVPHVIAPHKLEGVWIGGNRYAHELGQLAEGDRTTGISYSPSAEAFHIDGWRCVLFVQPLIFLLLFVTTDTVCGDLRAQPWGLLPLLLFSHIAPEQLLGGTIMYVWLGNVGTIFAIFVCGFIAPVFGRLLKGRERAPVWTANLRIPTMTATPPAEVA